MGFFSGRMGMSNAERQRKFREKRDKDPDRRQTYLEKEKKRYEKDKKSGKKKSVKDMTEREKRSARKKINDKCWYNHENILALNPEP